MSNQVDMSKFTSGQFITVVLTTLTYCFIVGFTAVFYMLHASADKVEGFAVGLVMGFASMAGIIYKSYFDRERTKVNGNDVQTKT